MDAAEHNDAVVDQVHRLGHVLAPPRSILALRLTRGIRFDRGAGRQGSGVDRWRYDSGLTDDEHEVKGKRGHRTAV